MKIKGDFVTNSSTTSFMVVGFRLSRSNPLFKNIEDLDEDVINKELDLSGKISSFPAGDSNDIYIGRVSIATDYEVIEEEIDLNKIKVELEEVARRLEITEPIKIFVGSYYS